MMLNTTRGSAAIQVLAWALGFLALVTVLRFKPWVSAPQVARSAGGEREELQVGFLPVT